MTVSGEELLPVADERVRRSGLLRERGHVERAVRGQVADAEAVDFDPELVGALEA